MREIALDTETTGLDPASGHRMVEIGCVELQGRVKTGEYFHVYLNPERSMPDEAYRVHGLSDEFLKDKPLFTEVVEDFLAFIGDDPLVIHNASFDMRFINAELARLNFKPLPMKRTVDTVQIARKKFPGSPANLDALCKRFNIDLSARTKHGALLDAELLADVYLELLGGAQAMMSLEEENRRLNEIQIRHTVPARDFPIPANEREAHDAFIETLTNPLWKKLETS